MDRIVMIVFSVYPDDPRVKREAEALIETGRHVDVICLNDGNQERKEIINKVHAYRIFTRRLFRNKWELIWQYGLFMFLSSLLLLRLSLIKKYQFVHVHNLPDILVLTAGFPKVLGAKVILDVHDIMPELFMSKFGMKRHHFLTLFILLMERISMRFSDHIITASPFFTEIIIRRMHNKSKVTTLINLPDLKWFNPIHDAPEESDDQVFKMVYTGTISHIHGLDIAIKAVKIIVEETSIPIEFHIYGSASDYTADELIELCNRLQLNHVVFFHGSIPLETIPNLLMTMQIGVVPKRDDVFARYALSTKLFEYAAMGLPAVVSKTASDALYFNDSMVMFFQPENERDLAGCIIHLAENENIRKTLSVNSKKFVEEMNWDKIKKHLYEVYENLSN